MKEKFYGCSSMRGTRGDRVYYPHQFEPRTIVSRKLSEKKRKLDEKVAMNDFAFGGLGSEGGYLLPATRLGFPPTGRAEAFGHSRFVGINALASVSTAVKIDPSKDYDPDKKLELQFTCLIDYPNLILAQGKVPPITVTATLNKEARKVMYEQEADTVGDTNHKRDDFAYGVMYDPMSKTCIVTRLRDRSESGSTSEALPAAVDLTTVVIYAFTCRATGKPTSNSTCLLHDPTSKVAVARIAKDMGLEVDLDKSVDKFNTLVDKEIERRDAAWEKKQQEELEARQKMLAENPTAELVAEDEAEEEEELLDELFADSSETASVREARAALFAERMEILGKKIYALKRRYAKRKEESKKKK